jgi:hypothetical protein
MGLSQRIVGVVALDPRPTGRAPQRGDSGRASLVGSCLGIMHAATSHDAEHMPSASTDRAAQHGIEHDLPVPP